jgi:biotin carboxylase
MCDKWELVHMLESAGLPAPPTALDDDVPPAPWIVKPVRASGGRGVAVVPDRESLAGARARAASASLDGRSVVQHLIEGHQLSIEGALTPRSSCLVITTRLVAEPPCATTLGHIAPSSLAPEETAAVRSAVEVLFRASGPYTGPVNVDVVLQPDGVPVVIDASPRLGGNRLPMLAELVTRWPLVSWAIGRALGGESEPPPATERAHVAVGVLGAARAGAFTWNERARSQLLADPSVVDLVVTADRGQTIGELTDSNGRAGYVVIRSPSAGGLAAARARLRHELADACLLVPGFAE